MLIETYSEKFFTSPKSPKKIDVNRHAINSENNITIVLKCMHLNVIKDLRKQFVDNFSFLTSKEKEGQKCK